MNIIENFEEPNTFQGPNAQTVEILISCIIIQYYLILSQMCREKSLIWNKRGH